MALCLGILALAPPAIVGGMGAIPSWGKYPVAVIAFVLAAWQIIGFAAVLSDATKLFNLYSILNLVATVVLLCFTIAFLITAAAMHTDTVDACVFNFEQPLSNNGLGVSEINQKLDQGRRTVCNILSWADVGLMGALILILGLTQLYMCFKLFKYGQRQRAAEKEARMPAGGPGVPMQPTNWSQRGGTSGQYEPVHAPAATDNAPLYETYTR